MHPEPEEIQETKSKDNNEKNIPTPQQKEKEQARIPSKNDDTQRSQGVGRTPCQGT